MPNSGKSRIVAWRGGLLCATLFLCVAVPPLYSHDPITTKLTWTQEISRVVYKRCAACHRPDGAAFSLLTYPEARPWAKAIRDQVRSRTMPPWDAVKGVGEFADDVSLSEPEIDLLVAWVEGGAPEGDAAYLISPPRAEKIIVGKTGGATANVSGIWQPKTTMRITAIAVKAPLEAWVSRKDGAIDRLIWIKELTKLSPREYVFRTPVTIQPGDTIHTTAATTLRIRPRQSAPRR